MREIVCISGSMRFFSIMLHIAGELTLDNKIVLMPFVTKTSVMSESVKSRLDKLHQEKIKLADIVYVVNKNGYIGESTQHEIEYATQLRKHILYLEPIGVVRTLH